jgi:hypothetical protein
MARDLLTAHGTGRAALEQALGDTLEGYRHG